MDATWVSLVEGALCLACGSGCSTTTGGSCAVSAAARVVAHASGGAARALDLASARELVALAPEAFELRWRALPEHERERVAANPAPATQDSVRELDGVVFRLEMKTKRGKAWREAYVRRVLEKPGYSGAVAPIPALEVAVTAAETAKKRPRTTAPPAPPTCSTTTTTPTPTPEKPFDPATQAFLPHAALDSLQKDLAPSILATTSTPPSQGRFAPEDLMQSLLLPTTRRALAERMRITRFYAHQGDAIKALAENHDVVVTTATSSGKTLCFAAPILNTILTSRGVDGEAGWMVPPRTRTRTALLLYPTKALCRDQTAKLQLLMHPEGVSVRVVDGDTPPSDREDAREACDVVVTNPDLIHATILPEHAKWGDFLSRLAFVVVDEAHAFSGAFGSHVALVLRRLQRLLPARGQHVRFIVCSATVRNPLDMFHRLLGPRPCPLTHVRDAGCTPQGERVMALWRPRLMGVVPVSSSSSSSSTTAAVVPLPAPTAAAATTHQTDPLLTTVSTNDEDNAPTSAIHETAKILANLVLKQVRTLAFCRTRKLVELVLKYTNEILPAPLRDKCLGYRGGYRPEERREIERRMFAGELLAVAATNALELGIDIGNLDAVVILGFPGSISSTLQQTGRAGRGGRPALAVMVCFEGPIDRYFLRNPDMVFRGEPDPAALDPTNDVVLRQHLLCAAAEAPLDLSPSSNTGGDAELFRWPLQADAARAALEADLRSMENDHQVVRVAIPPAANVNTTMTTTTTTTMWRAHQSYARPALEFGLRVIDAVNILVKDAGTGAVLDEVAYSRAFFETYPGAVFMHQAKTYLITSLDFARREALARRADVDYHTRPRDSKDVIITKTLETLGPDGRLATGVVKVAVRVFGFTRVKFRDVARRNRAGCGGADSSPVHLPPLIYETRATWVRVPESCTTTCRERLSAGVHAAQHLMCRLLPLAAGPTVAETTHIDEKSKPLGDRLLVYDRDPGGVGVADAAFHGMQALINAAIDVLESCPCDDDTGCPGCVVSPTCSSYNAEVDKKAALCVLHEVRRVVFPSPDSSSRQASSAAEAAESTPERVRAANMRRAKALSRARLEGLGNVDFGWTPHVADVGEHAVRHVGDEGLVSSSSSSAAPPPRDSGAGFMLQ